VRDCLQTSSVFPEGLERNSEKILFVASAYFGVPVLFSREETFRTNDKESDLRSMIVDFSACRKKVSARKHRAKSLLLYVMWRIAGSSLRDAGSVARELVADRLDSAVPTLSRREAQELLLELREAELDEAATVAPLRLCGEEAAGDCRRFPQHNGLYQSLQEAVDSAALTGSVSASLPAWRELVASRVINRAYGAVLAMVITEVR
jgi:hypothetical protein